MSVRYKLSMLCPQTSRINQGFGGIPEFTPYDVAAALSQLTPLQSILMRAKYCGQDEYKKLSIAVAYRLKKQKRRLDHEFCRRIAELAVFEYISPGVCNRCGGSAIDIINNKTIDCPRCRGTGKRSPTNNSRARKLGVHPWWWERHGVALYNTLIDWISSQEHIAVGKMNKSLHL